MLRFIAMAAAVIPPVILLFTGRAFPEETHQLEKIIVTPSRIHTDAGKAARSVTVLEGDSIRRSVYTAIPDAIGNQGGVDIRRRGPEGVQADVSIRGTTFEQNTVLIDGVRLNDPQTGHHNMDLPVTAFDIERIEILKGPASSLYGANSFGGVVNIVTRRPDEAKILAEVKGGSYDYFSSALSASGPLGAVSNRISVSEDRSTGYMPETEFNILSVSDRALIKTDFGDYDFLFGYTKKDFGAGSFYSNLYPNEEEHTETRFFKALARLGGDSLSVEPKLYLKRHRDKFALDANRPGWQTNYHTAYNYGGEINIMLKNPLFDAAAGFELSRDTIDSTNIQTHKRTADGMYIEISPHMAERLYLNIGMREDRFTYFGWQYSPSASARYELSERLAVRSSIGRSYRIPTFTDLYYKDSANIGNADLNPESAWNYEAGVDYRAAGIFEFSGTFFRRDSYDTIDWTRSSARDPWRVSNIGRIETNGLEIALSLKPPRVSDAISVGRLSLDYTALDQYRKHDYLSKYALDYLKQQITGAIDCDIFGIRNIWAINYKKRIGDSGYIVVDAAFSKAILKNGQAVVEAFLDVTNLFDEPYSEQSDIPMPGRWIKSGARAKF